MSEIVDITKNLAHFNVAAVCLAEHWDDGYMDTRYCHERWIATVPCGTNLFTLQCPKCMVQNSFAMFLPEDYIEYEEEE